MTGVRLRFFSLCLAALAVLPACQSHQSEPDILGTYAATAAPAAGISLTYHLELKKDGTASFQRQQGSNDLARLQFGLWERKGNELLVSIFEADSLAVTSGREKVAATLDYKIEQDGRQLRSVDGKGPDFERPGQGG